jgi:hypothetical protein
MIYTPKWDLSTIPRDLLRAEYAKSIKPPAPRAKVLRPCPKCAGAFGARDLRKHIPACNAVVYTFAHNLASNVR